MHEPPPPANIANDHDLPPEIRVESLRDAPEEYELGDNYPLVSNEEDSPDQPEAQKLGYVACLASSGDQERRDVKKADVDDRETQPNHLAPTTNGGDDDNNPPQNPGVAGVDEPDPEDKDRIDDGRQQEKRTDSIEPPVIVYTAGISDDHIKHIAGDVVLEDPIGTLVGDALAGYALPPGERTPEELSDQEFDELADAVRKEVYQRLEFIKYLDNLAWNMEADLEEYYEGVANDDDAEIVVMMDGLDQDGEPVVGHDITTEPNAEELVFSTTVEHPFKTDEEGASFFDDLLWQVQESGAVTARGTLQTTSGEMLYCKIDTKPSLVSQAITVEVRDSPLPDDFRFVLRATIMPDEGSIEFGMRAQNAGIRHPDMKPTDLLSFVRSAFQYCEDLGIDIQYINEVWVRGRSVLYDQYMRALPETGGEQIAAVQKTLSARVYQRRGFEVMEVDDDPESNNVMVRFKKTNK